MTDDDTPPSAPKRPTGDVHARAMRRFDDAVLPQIPVRMLALAARRFADVPGAMWEGAAGDQFGDSIKLEFPKLKRALRKLDNDYRQNRIEPDFRPSGGASDADTAETLNGLYRADARYFKAQQARDNARAEASKGGFGAYRLCNDWADPLDKDSDHQRVNPAALIADADQCVFFGASTLYDKSDAKYAFVLTAWSIEAFEEEYPEAEHTGWPENVARRSQFDWFRPDTVTVCEYYEIEQRNVSLVIFEQKDSKEEHRAYETDLTADDWTHYKQRGFTHRKRKVMRRQCYKYVLSGAEILENRSRIAGGNIPVVPVYGERAYVNGVEWFRGLVQQNMDMVRVFNAVMSSLYEITTLAPYQRPIFAAEQMPPNLAAMWARGNIDRHPYALVNPLLDPVSGGIAAAGPVGEVASPQVPATLAAMVEMLNGLFAEDDQEPDQVKANTSADAMDIAAARVDAKSGVFLDNDRQSTQRGGELYLAMAAEVYVEPGRTVETMTEDGDDGEATLHEDYSDGGDLKVRNDFAEGRYKVVADVAETTVTRRDRTVKQCLSLAKVCGELGNPELGNAALVTAVMNQDGEGMDGLQKLARRQALQLGLVEPTEDEQKEAAQAQQGQPDPATMLAQSKVQVDEATVQQKQADARLKLAQAEAVGGPEQAPEAPSGLHAADPVETVSKLASARLNLAKADHLTHDIHDKHIRTGAQLAQDAHDRAMAEQQTEMAA